MSERVIRKRRRKRFFSDTHKECGKCREIKPHSEFSKDSKSEITLYLSSYCKKCTAENQRERYSSNIDNPEFQKSRRNSYIKSRHGISLQEYEERLLNQKHLCSLCETPLLSYGRGTHLDHCHKTGKLRDILCTNCNRGLGHFKENIKTLQKAIKYLQHYNE